jgi:uncharacterized protein
MNLFLLGATGRTGQLIVEQALSRGHGITAIVRDPAIVTAQLGLRIESVDPLRADLLAPSLAGNEVVISCLGQKSREDARLLEQAASVTLDAMARTGVRGSMGVGVPSPIV